MMTAQAITSMVGIIVIPSLLKGLTHCHLVKKEAIMHDQTSYSYRSHYKNIKMSMWQIIKILYETKVF
jgi:hypothetical protein